MLLRQLPPGFAAVRGVGARALTAIFGGDTVVSGSVALSSSATEPPPRACEDAEAAAPKRGPLGRFGWALTGLVAVLLVLAIAPAAQALTALEEANIEEVDAWVYRNGGEESPMTCGTVCNNLWEAEQSHPKEASQYWTDLAELMVSTGMWGTFENISFFLEANERYSGILVEGPAPKWIWFPVPKEAFTPPGVCIEQKGDMHIATEKFSPSTEEYESPEFHTRSWVIKATGCGIGFNGIYQYDPERGEGPCKSILLNPIPDGGNGWLEKRWRWNSCYEGLFGAGKTPLVAAALHQAFRYANVEAYTGQTSEVVLKATAGSAIAKATMQTKVEAALESTPVLGPWVNWVLEGKKGPAPDSGGSPAEANGGGGGDPSPGGPPPCTAGNAVNCATGNESISQVDLSVGGRGPGLSVTRTYNSQAAASAAGPGTLGYGWSAPYSAFTEEPEANYRTVTTNEGAVLRFRKQEGQWKAVSPLIQAKLQAEGSEYVLTYPDQTVYTFSSGGRLASIKDRNNNTITMHRSGEGRLESVTDEASRGITFTYNGSGEISEAKDPLGHPVKYEYDGAGNLEKVTEPGEAAATWKFKYDGSHQMTVETDGRGNSVERTYDGSHRVSTETDALSRKRKWEYAGSYGKEPATTTITEPNGSTTREQFNVFGELTALTRAYGSEEAATTSYAYNPAGELQSSTNARGYTTTYTYDANRNKTSETDPLDRKTEWAYNSTHDVISSTTPKGETTTIKRDEHGNAETVERPAPGETTQKTKYKYTAHGQVESDEDPLKHVWKYEYNSHGDRTAEIDPEGDKGTWGYDEDSNTTSSVSPRGNVEGGEPTKYTTKIGRDAQERPEKVTDPLGNVTKYAYDKAGNLEKVTDANLHATSYTYDADNEPTKIKQANGDTTETEYDAEGRVISQTDGNKHLTKYKRDLRGEVTEVEDPVKHKTTKKYDAVGNITKVTDPKGRTTSYEYDPAEEPTEIKYSEEATPSVHLEYDTDGNRTKMEDGTGTSKYTYDQLARLTETKDGHGDVVKYEYDLANQTTKITYPNTKAVLRKYDKAGRLEKVEDWLEHSTTFGYDADSEPTKAIFPSNEDKYTYNEADQQTKTEIKKGSEALASLTYKRGSRGELTSTTQTGLPGEEKTVYKYDENNRVTKAGTTKYEYDAADNLTSNAGTAYTYSTASELEKAGTTTYSYNQPGQRTERIPPLAANTKYGYDQTGNLTKVNREKEGATPEIKDSYAYDGTSLRASESIGASTTYMTWSTVERLPLLLTDGSNSYMYGAEGDPIEQIDNEGVVHYLHHDQAGSTRLITTASGTVSGKCSYSAYGSPTCEGSTTTPLGYDGQYTSSDTGLIYLRARTYDPATAQFLTRDPLDAVTHEPYSYVADDPLDRADPSGRLSIETTDVCIGPVCVPVPAPPPVVQGFEEAVEGAEWVATGVREGAEISWGGIEGVFSSAHDKHCVPKGTLPADEALKRIARETGIPKGKLHERLEKGKKYGGLSPKDKTRVNPETGDIYDAETGEHLGNVIK
jgi:RHS repeat-associated protein